MTDPLPPELTDLVAAERAAPGPDAAARAAARARLAAAVGHATPGAAGAFGAGKVQGDYSFKVDYRSIGIGSIDPNINDSDFAFSFLNQQGWKAAFSYNVTDFTNLNVTYFNTRHKEAGLNQATIAARDHTQLLQLDLVVKF